MALLELRDISKRFGGLQALARVSMKIEEGMIASLIGPNGAGKTTLFNTLTGSTGRIGGEMRFQERSLIGLKPDRLPAPASAGRFKIFGCSRI